MQLPDRTGLHCNCRRLPPAAPLSCDRGGPVRKIDDILTELLDQYRIVLNFAGGPSSHAESCRPGFPGMLRRCLPLCMGQGKL